jgi:hypothetical protein
MNHCFQKQQSRRLRVHPFVIGRVYPSESVTTISDLTVLPQRRQMPSMNTCPSSSYSKGLSMPRSAASQYSHHVFSINHSCSKWSRASRLRGLRVIKSDEVSNPITATITEPERKSMLQLAHASPASRASFCYLAIAVRLHGSCPAGSKSICLVCRFWTSRSILGSLSSRGTSVRTCPTAKPECQRSVQTATRFCHPQTGLRECGNLSPNQ